jgi:hypothetical protein
MNVNSCDFKPTSIIANQLGTPSLVVEKFPEVDLCQVLGQAFMCFDPCKEGRGELAAHHRLNEH